MSLLYKHVLNRHADQHTALDETTEQSKYQSIPAIDRDQPWDPSNLHEGCPGHITHRHAGKKVAVLQEIY